MTHPSEPNYIAVAGGDFFGNAVDDFRELYLRDLLLTGKLTDCKGAIPMNISTIVDLLDQKNISWASCECVSL